MDYERSINDPIHGVIEFRSNIFKYIDTLEFQRLRKIHQLGMVYMVYPTGDHKRFEHCLGVAHLAKTLITNLRNKQPELDISQREIELVTIGGLLHDIGHGPFSHSFEAWLHKKGYDFDHEEMSVKIIRNMITKYNLNYTDHEVNIICGIIKGEYIEGEKRFLFEIVHNPRNGIDVDKFDYLMRDSYKTFGSSVFNPTRLMNSARVIDDEICFNEKDAYEVSELYQKRFSMWKKVYSHPTSIIIGLMIEEVLELVDKRYKITESINDPNKYCKFTDAIIDVIKFSGSNSMRPAKKIIEDIESRKLYKKIGKLIVPPNHNLGTSNDIIDRLVRESNDEINKDNIRVTTTIMNYSKGSANPINYVSFYNKKDVTNKYNLKKDEISRLLPEHFSECCIWVFSTSRDEDKLSIITRAFESFKKQVLE